MDYRFLLQEENESVQERFELSRNRLKEIGLSGRKSLPMELNTYFSQTALFLYRCAGTYLLTPVMEHWNEVAVIKGSNQRMNYVESIVHNTKVHRASYDFDDRFYKFPSYLRRSAIVAAIGAVASYKSNYENWLKAGSNGKEPAFSYDRHQCPALYRGDMFKWDMNGNALVKVYENNDWVWRELSLRKTDVSYFEMRTAVNNICKVFSPVLEKKHGKYFRRNIHKT